MAVADDRGASAGAAARVVRPPGLPSAAGVVEEEAIGALAESQLTDARKAAENWRTGLAGLLTLLTAILVVKGKSSVEMIAVGWRWPVGITLLAAVVAGSVGTYYSLAAAYGRPKVVATIDIRRAGGVPAYEGELAEKVIQDLSKARQLAFLTLGLVTLAVALTWIAPGPPPSAYLQVQQSGGQPVCGELQGVEAGQLKLKVKGGQQRLPLSAISSMSVVGRCPSTNN